jgi:cathepsin B
MQSTIVSAALIAAAQASVHPFFAESNFACGMCQQAIGHAKDQNFGEMQALYQLFPALEEKIQAYEGDADLLDVTRPEKTCTMLGLCGTESIATMLLNEMPADLTSSIEYVNNHPNATWTATANAKWDGASLKEIRQTMGTVVDPKWTVKSHMKTHNTENVDFPVNFDAREAWPECVDVINHVRDQANCGSCWAHGTTEALNDRMCIATGGQYQTLLSVADTTACCNGKACFSFGCNGGQVATPWNWFKKTGVVTGGDFGEGELCYDYTMPQCAHHVTVEGLPGCDDTPTIDPVCESECQTNATIDYTSDKVKGASSYGISGVENIKMEIMTNGTVTAAFTVYIDFLTYSSGVYQHMTGEAEGGHAIKMIGWGVENGEDYWLCVNSWNNTWGDKGTFKILMGNCGINDQIHAGAAI